MSTIATTVKERPILFSAPMVRAILDGRKTQTRRVVKPQPPEWIDDLHGGELRKRAPYWIEDDEQRVAGRGFQDDRDVYYKIPYGRPGDRLWVKETFSQELGKALYPRQDVAYKADWCNGDVTGWKPSIFMPRWASRITLEIVNVRVERLQDISESDAIAEGSFVVGQLTAIERFMNLWVQINGVGSVDANPWVWVVDFKTLPTGREAHPTCNPERLQS